MTFEKPNKGPEKLTPANETREKLGNLAQNVMGRGDLDARLKKGEEAKAAPPPPPVEREPKKQKPKETPIDPKDSEEIIEDFKKIVDEVFTEIPKEWDYEMKFYDEILAKIPNYYYNLAILQKWGKKATEAKLRIDMERLRDSLSKEGALTEIGNFFQNDIWRGIADVTPESGENRDVKLIRYWQEMETGLMQAQTWFYDEYVSEGRDMDDFAGSKERFWKPPVIGPITKPFSKRMPIEIVNTVNIPFFCKSMAADAAVNYADKAYEASTKSKSVQQVFAERFKEFLVNHYAVTFVNNTTIKRFREKTREDADKITAKIITFLVAGPEP